MKTNALRILEAKYIPHEQIRYDCDDEEIDAISVADKIGAEHEQVFNARIDVQFDDLNVVQPDIVVVMRSNRIVTPTKIKGVPELIIEILSPSTRERDQQLKKELYEHNRVPEFWIVDADDQSISCYRLSSDGNYSLPTHHSDEISIKLSDVTARVDLRKVW